VKSAGGGSGGGGPGGGRGPAEGERERLEGASRGGTGLGVFERESVSITEALVFPLSLRRNSEVSRSQSATC
jgi:hypothetical protein